MRKCSKEVLAKALALREKSHEVEALQLRVHFLEGQRGGEGSDKKSDELQTLKMEFEKYKQEAEEAIQKLVEEEVAARQHVARLHQVHFLTLLSTINPTTCTLSPPALSPIVNFVRAQRRQSARSCPLLHVKTRV